jgi:hypothetical protein
MGENWDLVCESILGRPYRSISGNRQSVITSPNPPATQWGNGSVVRESFEDFNRSTRILSSGSTVEFGISPQLLLSF